MSACRRSAWTRTSSASVPALECRYLRSATRRSYSILLMTVKDTSGTISNLQSMFAQHAVQVGQRPIAVRGSCGTEHRLPVGADQLKVRASGVLNAPALA